MKRDREKQRDQWRRRMDRRNGGVLVPGEFKVNLGYVDGPTVEPHAIQIQTPTGIVARVHGGMTKRQRIAADIAAGILSSPLIADAASQAPDAEWIADYSVRVADAILARCKETPSAPPTPDSPDPNGEAAPARG